MPTRQQLLEDAITAVVRLVRYWPPAAPEPFVEEITGEKLGAFSFEGESEMVDGITFDVPAKPAVLPTDAMKRVVSWSWDRGAGNGAQAQPEIELAVDRTTGLVTPDKIVGLIAPQGSAVHVVQTDIDDQGNKGAERVRDFEALDKIGPVAPEDFAEEITGEVIGHFPDDVL